MMMKKLILVGGVLAAGLVGGGEIVLPMPKREGTFPLMRALNERKTARAFADRELEGPLLSSLLWAANGINRPDGRRTAPTGMNVQDIDVYVMTKAGVYRHDAKANRLVSVGTPGDHRAVAGKQAFAQTAPLNLFFVQDTARSMKTSASDNLRYGGIHAGAIMQNVYLFCAQEGLATVARAYLDYAALAKTLDLKPTQRVILGQTVGYPAPPAPR